MTALQSWIHVRTDWSDRMVKLAMAITMVVAVIMAAGSVILPAILWLIVATTFYVGVVYASSYLPAWFRLSFESKERTRSNWHLAAVKERENSAYAVALAFGFAFYFFAFIAAGTFVADEVAKHI